MTLRLSIENMDRLPDGGPLRVEVKGRGLDIGRDAHLDWTLPDPTRHISSKHCEIRFRDGDYWLHDVSTNGTFVNGAQFRLDAPYRLRNGDRLAIGQYVIAVEVEGQGARAPVQASPAAATGADVWGAVGDVAAPDDRAAYRPRSAAPPPADFLDFASNVAPAASAADAFAAPPAADAWLSALPAAPVSPPPRPVPPPTPNPVRPARPAPRPAAPETAFAAPAEAAPASAPAAHRVAPPAPAGDFDAVLLARIAEAAGVPARAIEGRDPSALADDIGRALRLTAHHLAQMLASRAETKSLIRSSSRTMIRALENNPLKFASAPEEALAIMFGPPTRNYLDAAATIEQSFSDLKAHQMLTFGAMQAALETLFDDLAPEKIDKSVEADRGIGAIVGSRKAKLWDVYAERWRAMTKRADGRLNDAFMAAFAQAYDRLQNKRG